MKYVIDSSTLTNIANAIRNKTNKTGVIKVSDFATEINNISGGGGGIEIPAPTAGNYPVLQNHNCGRIAKTSLTDSTLSLTVPVSGTYRIRWTAFRTNTSGTWGTRVYVNGTAKGTENTTWTNSYYQLNSVDLALNKGDVVKVYARARSTSYYIYVSDLTLSVADNGFSQL